MTMVEWISIGVTALVGVITIVAIFCAPIVALRVQKEIETHNEQKQRKLNIFTTLMATRAEPVSFEHVKALNMIDIEFYLDKEITTAWNTYRDHLNSYPQNPTEADEKIWNDKKNTYLTDLLFEMSKLFGYNFDKVLLKKGAYAPLAHGHLNMEQTIIRRNLAAVLTGFKPLKVELTDKVEKPISQKE